MKNSVKDILSRVGGAITRRRCPFSDLEVPVTEGALSEEVRVGWVVPFYRIFPGDDAFRERYVRVRAEVSVELTQRLLAEFNWRPRLVGGYFAAIEGYAGLETQIGNLLLRSDVCFAGLGYCLALASFGSDASLAYLKRYLEYYLKRKDLWYNQVDCMAAVAYLDAKNGTAVMQDYVPTWRKFVKDRPNCGLEICIRRFSGMMDGIERLREGGSW